MARTAGSHSDITGPRIEAAALRLIARHGFAAVSMRQIAAEVGVQAGALYNYIPDKQTLLARLMIGHMEDLLEAAQTLQGGDPLARLEEFVRFHIDQNRERGDAVFVAYMELRSLTDENFARVEALRRAYEARLEDVLVAGVEAGAFKITDVRITARALIAMLNGVNTWFRESGPRRLDEVQDIYWDMARGAVGGG
ncbi:TetR/AcrR family transcriptional regulator [Aliishimia ponticola]|uniref:TetR/AcrR family transcriptional regulator n=1 Tax=Aliishimia ponticola TaxID=2499833 RepID=A0A4S4NCD9_9RHOB|nr:TetR/AcrR family transcriptional regulator [Aliishimia ponticola]THH35701.1 TetR/AcrR family transcriptional regulator [Aliishimia ponticola]